MRCRGEDQGRHRVEDQGSRRLDLDHAVYGAEARAAVGAPLAATFATFEAAHGVTFFVPPTGPPTR